MMGKSQPVLPVPVAAIDGLSQDGEWVDVRCGFVLGSTWKSVSGTFLSHELAGSLIEQAGGHSCLHTTRTKQK
jgi:hypothetical protein